jgi:hypothetical protein
MRKHSIRSLPDFPRGVAVAELCLISGYDCLANHLHCISIKAGLLFTLCNENKVMDKHYLILCPSVTKEALRDILGRKRQNRLIAYC